MYNPNDHLAVQSAVFMSWIREYHPDYFPIYLSRFAKELKPTKKERTLWNEWTNMTMLEAIKDISKCGDEMREHYKTCAGCAYCD